MPPAPSTRQSIKIHMTIPYRGSTKTFSMRFHFNGPQVVGNTAWENLSSDIRTSLRPCLPSGVTIVGATGYDAGSEVPVWSETVSQVGTLAGASATPGDAAVMIRWTTDARSSKNHPVYLFNWCHGANWSGSGSSDTLLAAQKTAFTTFAVKWSDAGTGFSDGTGTHKRCGPYGAVGLVGTCDQYVRHRDFVN